MPERAVGRWSYVLCFVNTYLFEVFVTKIQTVKQSKNNVPRSIHSEQFGTHTHTHTHTQNTPYRILLHKWKHIMQIVLHLASF
jgi:hypothetical protein